MNDKYEKYVYFDYQGVRNHPRSYMKRRAVQFHPFNPLKMLDESDEARQDDGYEARSIETGAFDGDFSSF
ncbi:MAG TPA: hypothetical protein DCO86_02835 [Spirochaetaceae bacterium]|nr:hypothetical protein [Spirochaetaceae bacterium]